MARADGKKETWSVAYSREAPRRVTLGGPTRWCVLSLAALLPRVAAAHADRPRIAVEHAHTDAAARRVLAEIRNAGLDPVDVRNVHGSLDVSELADRYKAVAVLSLRRPGRIELAVLSPDTGEVIYESTVTSKGGTPASVRAAEELHGRLIDLPKSDTRKTAPVDTPPAAPPDVAAGPPERDAEPARQEPEVPRDAPPPAFARRRPSPLTEDLRVDRADVEPSGRERDRKPALWVGGGAGASSGVGGLDQVPVVQLEARFEPTRYFSLAAFGLLPLAPQNIAAPEGSAELRAHIVGGLLRATVFEIDDRVRLVAGAGGGAAVVSMSGSAAPGHAGRTTSAATGVGLATVGLGARLLPWLGLRADATGGLAAYRPVMRFDGRDVAAWGPTTLTFTGGLELDALGFGSGRP